MVPKETIREIVSGPSLNQGRLPIWRTDEMHIREQLVRAIAVRTSYAQQALQKPMYGDDFVASRLNIIATETDQHSHFLSRALRKGLRRVVHGYENEQGAIVADEYRSTVAGHSYHEIRIAPPVLFHHLEKKHLVLLWCIDSFRYSEQDPQSLGLTVGSESIRQDAFTYRIVVNSKRGLPERMVTVVRVSGKRILSREDVEP